MASRQVPESPEVGRDETCGETIGVATAVYSELLSTVLVYEGNDDAVSKQAAAIAEGPQKQVRLTDPQRPQRREEAAQEEPCTSFHVREQLREQTPPPLWTLHHAISSLLSGFSPHLEPHGDFRRPTT